MRLGKLREEVLEANLEIVRRGLVLYTFGNASGFDKESGLVAIKPSGVAYEKLTPDDMVITDLAGHVVEGSLRPSSDLATHLALYRAFEGIGGVAHTHSRYATAWAQAHREIPCFGTTHADYFLGPIPVTERLRADEIESEYELNTGNAILRVFESLNPQEVPGVLVAGHAPFVWGPTPADAAHNAVIVEELAHLAFVTLAVNPDAVPISNSLRDKHFLRKRGAAAYYGQAGRAGHK
jgi:L-ribulose-5-phosphate 4-epimerase